MCLAKRPCTARQRPLCSASLSVSRDFVHGKKIGRALPPFTFLGGAGGSRIAGHIGAGRPTQARSSWQGHARTTRFTTLHVDSCGRHSMSRMRHDDVVVVGHQRPDFRRAPHACYGHGAGSWRTGHRIGYDDRGRARKTSGLAAWRNDRCRYGSRVGCRNDY